MIDYYNETEYGYEIKEDVKANHDIPIVVKGDLIDNIINCAIAGGISYWAVVHNDPIFYYYPDEMPLSAKIVNILFSGYDVKITTLDDERLGYLSLRLLLIGLSKYIQFVLDNEVAFCIDANSSDMIFQYALFDDIIYA